MLSENDKQAILNGAFGVTRKGQKAKFLGKSGSSAHTWWCFYNDDGSVDDFKPFQSVFEYRENKQAYFDIIGLWQNKPEPFDLEKALAGEPVLLRDGSKAYIFHCINDEFAKKHNISYQLLGVIVDSLEGKQLTRSWAKSGIFNEVNPYPDFDIIGMWKEPEPQLSNNSLQLPKPISHFENAEHLVYMLAADVSTGEFKAKEVKAFERNASMRVNGRYYNSKQDVIKVIEAITGKPYVE